MSFPFMFADGSRSMAAHSLPFMFSSDRGVAVMDPSAFGRAPVTILAPTRTVISIDEAIAEDAARHPVRFLDLFPDDDDSKSDTSRDTDRAGVLKHFQTAWLHSTRCPSLSNIKVYPITLPSSVVSAFRSYQSSKASAPPHGSATTGNTVKRFHGTKCASSCRLSPSCTSLCSNSSCAACCIARGGFKVSKAASTGRFGCGVYFTATSSKAHDYTNTNAAGCRIILVAEVVCGRAHVATSSWWNSQSSPPSGCDSVVGDPQKTLELNYDEVVVYRDDACLPCYMLIIRD